MEVSRRSSHNMKLFSSSYSDKDPSYGGKNVANYAYFNILNLPYLPSPLSVTHSPTGR